MTYTPINWQTGDTITAEKMNKMDNGWGLQESQLFSETVTTTQMPIGNKAMGYFEYIGTDYPETLNVTFNGAEYVCPFDGEGGYYTPTDAPDLFRIDVGESGMPWNIITSAAGTYSVSAVGNLMQVSDEFNSAVHKSIGNATAPMLCIAGETTYDEMTAAWENLQMMYFAEGSLYFITEVWSDGTNQGAYFIPESQYFTATFDQDGIFTIEYN